jgi:hypothetical protein
MAKKKEAMDKGVNMEGPDQAPARDLNDITDHYSGPLRNRSYGLRIDDDVEIQIIAGNSLISVEGRILSFKDDLEIVDKNASYHKITMDWIVDIRLIRHNRPLPELDPEMVRKTVKPKLKKSSVDHAYN